MKKNIGIIFTDIICQTVYEGNDGGGVTSVAFVQRFAIGAGAVVLPVVLRDGKYFTIRIVFDPRSERPAASP